MQLIIVLAMVLGIASVAFALQNNVPVTVTLLVWRFDSSLAMVLLLAFALGGLVVALASTPGTIRRQWTASRLARQIQDLEREQQRLNEEVAMLRSRAVTPEAVGMGASSGPEQHEDRPYVGLKQLIVGRDPASRGEPGERG